MKRKSITVASIIFLICVVLGNIAACTPTPTDEGVCSNITQVAAGDWLLGSHTVGLKSDGTVVAASWDAELAKWALL